MGKTSSRSVSDELEQRIRDDIDEWSIVESLSNPKHKLHIPNGDGDPICQDEEHQTNENHTTSGNGYGNDLDYKTVGERAYPPGFRDVCPACANLWEGHREGNDD